MRDGRSPGFRRFLVTHKQRTGRFRSVLCTVQEVITSLQELQVLLRESSLLPLQELPSLRSSELPSWSSCASLQALLSSPRPLQGLLSLLPSSPPSSSLQGLQVLGKTTRDRRRLEDVIEVTLSVLR